MINFFHNSVNWIYIWTMIISKNCLQNYIFFHLYIIIYSCVTAVHICKSKLDIKFAFVFYCIFISVHIHTVHLSLIEWDRGKQYVLWTRDCQCFPRWNRGQKFWIKSRLSLPTSAQTAKHCVLIRLNNVRYPTYVWN
jgi:hypothetical protein